MKTLTFGLAALLAMGMTSQAVAADDLKVVTTIKPLHSLVQNVLGDTAQADVLLDKGNVSPHDFQFKPSDVRAVQNADVVFYISPYIEGFLQSSLDTTDPTKARAVIDAPALTLLPYRDFNEHGDHGHDEHGHDDHGHEDEHEDHKDEHGHNHGATDIDQHIWLSPKNAVIIVDYVANTLATMNPDHAQTYQDNATQYTNDLMALDADIAKTLEAVQGVPFVVYHDAYQYFEDAYGLTTAGTLVRHPEQGASLAQVRAVKQTLAEQNVSCVFREPQFSDRLLNTLKDDADVRVGVLDPLGAELEPSTDLYATLLQTMAKSLTDCLS